MQVASVVHARMEATAPWGLKREEHGEEGMAGGGRPSGGSPMQFAHFGMISGGNCWLSVEGIPDPMPLTGGDCFLLAPGSTYALRDHPDTQARSFCEVAPRDRTQFIRYGGGGTPTEIVSGWFRFEPADLRTLTRWMPRLILVKADQARPLGLDTTLRMLASELAGPAPGSDLVVKRLADVLFIQCIRAHFGSRSEMCSPGLLQAIFDPQVGVALTAMHDRVNEAWTVESLAAVCGMSRSAFALKFRQLVGESPLEYLTHWRMQKATAMLRKGDRKLVDIAQSVGYDSDAAFSKAFKRTLGVAPREYGRSAQTAAGAA